MRPRSVERLKALLLILMAIFFAERFVSGKLYYYIGQRFGWLAMVAVALFILLAGSYDLVNPSEEDETGQEDAEPDHADHHGHSPMPTWMLLVVAVPLILGTLIPARPLGAEAVSTRGVSTTAVVVTSSESAGLTVVAGERSVLDWVRAIGSSSDPSVVDGEEVDVIGFVYRDERFDAAQFMVARFTITCCVADALAIGLVVQSSYAAALPTDSWVRVVGTFGQGELDGQTLPVVIADEITPVEPPEQPYLYP